MVLMEAPATTMKVTIRCTARLKSGRLCDHKVIDFPEEEWETLRKSKAGVECRRCGTVYILKDFI